MFSCSVPWALEATQLPPSARTDLPTLEQPSGPILLGAFRFWALWAWCPCCFDPSQRSHWKGRSKRRIKERSAHTVMTHYAQKSWLALAFQKTRNSPLPGRAPQWVSKLKKDNYCLARAFHKSIKDQKVRFPVHHCFPQSLWYSNRIVRDGRGWITALGNCRQSSAACSDNRTAGGRNRVTRTSATAPPPVQIPHADAINHITYQLHNADEVPPVRGDKPGITAQGDGWILLV